MKKFISFLCSIPGTFIITAICVSTALYMHRRDMDNRWWLPIVMGIGLTFLANIYLVFVFGSKTGEMTKGAKWIGITVIGILTIISIWAYISLRMNKVEFPSDYAVQTAWLQSYIGILIWTWFSLFWNMYIKFPYGWVPPSNSMK